MSKDKFQISFNEGTTIFIEGEAGECAYIVQEGTVDLYALLNGQSVSLTQFNKGDLFGEMALIDNQLRSGTAVAASDVTLLRVPKNYIETRIDKSDDIVSALLKVVLNRFREMRDRLAKVAMGKSLYQANEELQQLDRSNGDGVKVATYRIEQEDKLRQAFHDNHLELYYQPIISIADGSIAGCESLIRWRDPEKGLIPPIDFIGLAEDTGLIIPISEWIIEEACNARGRFAAIYPDIYVSVNLSPRQFESMSLVDNIAAIFDKTKVDTSKVYLEITETTLMSDPVQVANILSKLKALNTVIALDDFGTGYSSFSYLHRFPIDILKIDQSFVFTMMNNFKSKEIVRTLCTLASSLGMKVVAEGVEQQEELSQLNTFKADYGQGYYIAKPMPEKDFVEFLTTYQN